MESKENETTTVTEATEKQPVKQTTKKVVVKKQRYFVPSLGRSVEAANLDEVTKIVNKENKG